MIQFLDQYDELTPSEKKALGYILENKPEIPYLKINELAETAFVSKTVIINLAQKLGFSGYKELKYHISNLLREEVQEEREPFVSFEKTMKQAIEKTFSIASPRVLKSCSEMILSSGTLFIMARGTSKSVGYYLEHLLLSIGVQCIFIKDYNLSELFTNFVSEKDTVIFISLSGSTKRIVDTARSIHLKKANIISMTSFRENPLASYADQQLYCYTGESNTKYNDKISRIGFFIIVDLLINEVEKIKN